MGGGRKLCLIPDQALNVLLASIVYFISLSSCQQHRYSAKTIIIIIIMAKMWIHHMKSAGGRYSWSLQRT
jgi:hypothetical protein